ncbi:GH32 C-terminal domain-containing protein [Enterococcus gallinarum]|nr:GH32 C-terminal domain-containing protein [Enterococcus gallinarum]MCW3744598.1 GH32 C-terminal domain-containing protein [Enterococcus gallinarum]
MEVFINNGEYTFTSRLYPQKEQDQIVFSGTGSLAIQLWPFSN